MPIQNKSEMMLTIDLINLSQIMKIQIMNFWVIPLSTYNKQDHLEEEQVLQPEVQLSIGEIITQSKKDMLEVVLNKVGLHLLILIGLITELII